MSEVRAQLLITVVHGTWPRGFFPKIARFKRWVRGLLRRKRLGPPPPFWFEKGSPFLDHLSAELADIPHKISPVLWSGKNSISVRDRASQILADHLKAEHAEFPKATQLVIAHSHGGNIVLRALHRLPQPDSVETKGVRPLLVTLATPFIEVEHADFGDKPALIRIAVALALWMPLTILTKAYFPPTGELGKPLLIRTVVAFVFGGFAWWYWFSKRAARRRQNRVEELTTATRLGKIVSAQAQRFLIIRAVDDEASLAMAFSTVVNVFITRVIRYIHWIILGPFSIIGLSVFIVWYFKLTLEQPHVVQRLEWYEHAIQVVSSALILFLFGLLAVSRTAHGHELATSPLECQINTQSTPDAMGLSEVATVVWRTPAKSLRHGIYDHEDCPKAISDWVRSQICALPNVSCPKQICDSGGSPTP